MNKKKILTGIGILGIILIIVLVIFNGVGIFKFDEWNIFKSADTPLPSKKLQGMLQNQGYELVNIKTYHEKSGGVVPSRYISKFTKYGIERYEIGRPYVLPVVENPNPVRVYYLDGEGNVTQFFWLACQLCSIEYKGYPQSR